MLSANFDRFLFAYTVGSHIIIVSASIALSLILVIKSASIKLATDTNTVVPNNTFNMIIIQI